MYLKRLLLLVGILFIVNSLHSQQLEFMQPVGYHSPFLKSGQFISSLYYYSHQTKSDYSDYNMHNGNYNVNFVGYLGLTDYLTLSTNLSMYPAQKINWETGESTMKREIDFYINPEISLIYRPIKYLEIFSSLNYYQYTTTTGPYTRLQPYMYVDPVSGNIIVEDRMVQFEGMDPYDTKSYFFRFGLTYSGKLW